MKEFKTIDEQIDILKDRGLTIPDEAKAKEFLLRNNYYRVSGYSLTLRSHDIFYKSATFDSIVEIYSFDQELRHILLRHLENIEVMLKSFYSYEFSRRYGPAGYLEPSHFTDEQKYCEIIKKAEIQKENRLPHEPFLQHFVNDLNDDMPLWAYVDLLTISDISFLYRISDRDIQNAVAKSFGLDARGYDLLGSFIHSMTIIRNLCAHGIRLYNRIFQQKPRLSKKEKNILRKDKNGTEDNAHLFGFILIMKRLLPDGDFNELKHDIVALQKQYPFVRLKYYGFPDNWLNSIQTI